MPSIAETPSHVSPTELQIQTATESLTPYIHQTHGITMSSIATIALNHFAPPLKNDELIATAKQMARNDTDQPKWKETLDSTGIPIRFRSRSLRARVEQDGLSPTQAETAIVAESTAAAAILLRQAMAAHATTKLGKLIVSSAYLPSGMAQRVLAHAGLSSEDTVSYEHREFCAGTCNAFLNTIEDAQTDRNLAWSTVGIVAAERLGALEEPEHFTTDHLATSAIFGDQNAAFVFQPAAFEVVNNSRVTKAIDDGGTIAVDTLYAKELDELQNSHDAALLERYGYHDPHNRLIVTENGIFMRSQAPDSGMRVEMNNRVTGMHFGSETPLAMMASMLKYLFPPDLKLDVSDAFRGKIANAIARLATENFKGLTTIQVKHKQKELVSAIFDDLSADLRTYIGQKLDEIDEVIFHQPSKAVITKINKTLRELFKFAGFEQKLLDKVPTVRFLLDEMQSSNSSSATWLDSLKYLIQKGDVCPGMTVMIGAPGIGAVHSAAIVKILTPQALRDRFDQNMRTGQITPEREDLILPQAT